MHWKSLLEAQAIWIESTETEPSRPSDLMWATILFSPVDRSIIGVVLLPKRGGDSNGP